jgi:hypothetical protein
MNPTDAHYAAERKAAIARGEVAPEDMTSAELQAALAAMLTADPTLLTQQRVAPSPTDEQLQSMVETQEARHMEARVQRTMAPFEQAYLDDVQKHGADSPLVLAPRTRLHEAWANAPIGPVKDAYKEALDLKPVPKPSIFGEDGPLGEVEGA